MCGVKKEQQVIAENRLHDDGCEDPTELLTAGDLARRLRISIRQVRKLDAEGSLPNPVRLGKSVRWRLSEIGGWIAADCPSREMWEEAKGNND